MASSRFSGTKKLGVRVYLISLLLRNKETAGSGLSLRVLLHILFGEGPLNNTRSASTRHIRLPMKILSAPGRVVNQGSTFNKQE